MNADAMKVPQEKEWPVGNRLDQGNSHDPHREEHCDGIADKYSPQEILGILQICIQLRSASLARSHLLGDAPAAKCKNARFHSRAQERSDEANGQNNQEERSYHRFITSTSS
jgi:hypothetical protein